MLASVRGDTTGIAALAACETRFAQTFSASQDFDTGSIPELADVTGELMIMTQWNCE